MISELPPFYPFLSRFNFRTRLNGALHLLTD